MPFSASSTCNDTFLELKEVTQAGDTVLVKYDRLKCLNECFQGPDDLECQKCGSNPVFDYFKLPATRSDYILISGTKRKKQRMTKKIIQSLMDLQGNQCGYCFVNLTDSGMHVDHIFPVSLGGTNRIDNLCLSCPKCNLIAGQKEFKDYTSKKEYIQRKRNGRA